MHPALFLQAQRCFQCFFLYSNISTKWGVQGVHMNTTAIVKLQVQSSMETTLSFNFLFVTEFSFCKARTFP